MGDYTRNVIGNPPSLAAFFANWRGNKGDFLRFEGLAAHSRVSYREAAACAAGFAEYLAANGIAKGDRIVMWGENRPEWVVALWGCLLAGVVAVPIDFRSSGTLAVRIARIVDARVLMLGDDREAPGELPCPVWPLAHAFDVPRAQHVAHTAAVDDLAEVLFTSGATGEPKGVTITHRNILANLKPISRGIEKYRKYMGPFAPIRFLNLLPLSHMFGQSMAAFIPAMIAGEVWFTGGYAPADIVRLLHHRRVSVLVCVPQMLEMLRDHVLQVFPEAAEARRSAKWYGSWWQYRRVHRALGWKFWSFVVGAAPLDPELEEFWRKLGYVVIQGYGLTETAPVATLNHPFETRKGTVGKAIEGVEIRIAPDGEILLRGENVTPGYYGETDSGIRDAEGWLHTGDVGEMDAEGRLRILGRKKEMIVSPDGLNVYPEDVERVLNAVPGVRESAVVGAKHGVGEQVHAVLVLAPGAEGGDVVRAANTRLEPSQSVRGFSLWPSGELPRTSGTKKLKRSAIAAWVAGEAPAQAETTGAFTRPGISAESSLDELGLSSLDRIQLLMDVEKATGTRVSEAAFATARTVGDLMRARPAADEAPEVFVFPEWNRSWWARAIRRVFVPAVILPLTRMFAWLHVEGLENLRGLRGPVIFAANHQSHFDVPSILCALPPQWRYRVAPAMAKEFFDAWFHPKGHSFAQRFGSGLGYTLSALMFNAFPLPQREAGTREALRYAGELAGDGNCILIFPEGKRTEAGEINTFQPGVGMLASRLKLPVVPIAIEGLDRVLHRTAHMATPGRARIVFGQPVYSAGKSEEAIAKEIENAVRSTISLP